MRLAIALLFLLGSPGLAGAQNLIPFSGFDTSADLMNGYTNLDAQKIWSSVDVDNSSASGSLLITNDSGTNVGILVYSSCVVVDAGRAYEFGAWHFTQGLQPGIGHAGVQIQWRGPGCAGIIDHSFIEMSTVEGEWTRIAREAVAPSGAGAARLILTNFMTTGNPGEPREVFFDEVFLPEPGAAASGLAAAAALLLAHRSSGARRRRTS